MANPPSADASNPKVLPIVALLLCALAAYLLSEAFPVASHADDWPGPGVGAAIDLQLAGFLAFVAMIFSALAWRPRSAALVTVALAASALVYAGAAVCFSFVGLEPFCGSTAAFAGQARPSLAHDVLGTTCGLSYTVAYLVPWLVFAGLVIWKSRRARGAVS